MTKNILIIGNGGREHAILWKLSQSPEVSNLYIFPGNSAIESATSAKCADITSVSDHSSIISFCRKENISLVLIGPEAPLADGIVDALSAAGVQCFGPSKQAAQLESSKGFAKEFMQRNNIPTAKFRYFTDSHEAKAFLQKDTAEYFVVKADGLALGKGVVVASTRQEAIQAVDYVSQFGKTIVLEERLFGEEVSALCFTDGRVVKVMPFSQDHKRLKENDQGPNTGGMGAFAPYPLISNKDARFIEKEILLKTVTCLRNEGFDYKGVIYAGLILTKDGPKVLEYNCRFGDPETQVLIPLLRSDLYHVINGCVHGTLDKVDVAWESNKFACGVVLASGGYPASPLTGCQIEGIENVIGWPNTVVFYAGMKKTKGAFVTSGGRVLCAVGTGATLSDAKLLATKAAMALHFDGRQLRTDIAQKALKQLLSNIGLTYKDAGVDIGAGDALVENIKKSCAITSRSGADSVKLGGFGGMFDLRKAGFKDPVLVSGTDGVGTKLKIAHEVGIHETVGIDLVAMCVNDILTQGAEPLFFLDYYATGALNVDVASDVVKGIAAGCKDAGCALIGGETAEMPGFYTSSEYDLAGFAVGAIERENFLNQTSAVISPGDIILGLPSTGFHSNGYSLVRKVITEQASLTYVDPCPWDPEKTVGEALLAPTKIYVRQVLPLFQRKLVKASSHITGGGLVGNIPRVLPNGAKAVLDIQKWPVGTAFHYIQEQGGVAAEEMVRAFNCGIGFVLITSPSNKEEVKRMIQSEHGQVFEIGYIQKCGSDEPTVEINGLDEIFPQSRLLTSGIGNGSGKRRVAVLISGSGTNLQALIDYATTRNAGYDIALVISNVPNATGLERAKRAGIQTTVIPHEKKTRQVFENEIQDILVGADIEMVCLAGFMRILTADFVKKWTGRMINTHPSLLPSFKGAHAHKLALESGVRLTGCTIHFVEPEVDAGGIILQGSVPVYPTDTEETLSERVKAVEHRLLPKALNALAKRHVRLNESGNVEWTNDKVLAQALE